MQTPNKANPTNGIPKGRPLPSIDRFWIHQLAHTVGVAEAARVVGVGRHTIASAIAGFGVYPATALAVREARLRHLRDAA